MLHERTVTKQTPEGDRTFRIALWGDGSGITVWREDPTGGPEIVCVVGLAYCPDIFSGPPYPCDDTPRAITPNQLSAWESLCNADWPEFRATVNTSRNVRIRL